MQDLRSMLIDNAQKFAKWYPQRLLNLFIQDSTQPLWDTLALQQLLWASLSSQRKSPLRTITQLFTTSLLAHVPYVVRVQRQWLENAWRESRAAQVCDPLCCRTLYLIEPRRASTRWICQLLQEMQSQCGGY
jgi:hypothetical protein